MSQDRRENFRVPDTRLITEIIRENPFASSIVNISHSGIYTVRPVSSGLRGTHKMQLEIPLPEASESVWATGQIMYESIGFNSIGTGIRFLDMPRCHYSLICDLIEEQRKEILMDMLEEIRWRKNLAANPSPYSTPPPGRTTEETVRMYLLPERR